MGDLLFNPFTWLVGAVAIALLELLAPGFIFLGLGLAAGMIGILLFPFGGLFEQWSLGGVALLALYGVGSILSWWLLRKALGVRRKQEEVFSEDINDY